MSYIDLIRESEADLLDLERQLRGQLTAVRVQMLRLLKSGRVEDLQSCAPLLGYSPRQLSRWWRDYRTIGLEQLIVVPERPGRRSNMSAEAFTALTREIEADNLTQLSEVRDYLAEHWDIHYASLNGVWHMLRSNKLKLKRKSRRKKPPAAPQQELALGQ
jgi:transposase